MSLENGRNLFRGVLILVFVGIASWINLTIGLILLALMGVMILQSVITNWCPADLFLRRMGMKRRLTSELEQNS